VYTGVGELVQDPSTGDLIIGNFGLSIFAQRVSARDGSLLQAYTLSPLTSLSCRSSTMDVGGVTGAIYAVLVCGGVAQRVTRVHVVQPNGRVRSEFSISVPFAYRVRVDEWNNRLYVATFNLTSNYRTATYIAVFDLQGRAVLNVTMADPPLGFLGDLVLEPGRDGGDLILLDDDNRRLVGVARNGSIAFITALEPQTLYFDMEYAAMGEVYISVTDLMQVGERYFYSNSSVIRQDRQGRVLDRFVTWGSKWDLGADAGSEFGPITARGDDLFAFDYRQQSIFVWRNRREPTQLSVAGGTVPAMEQVASAPTERQRGRHGVLEALQRLTG
jgi:hypothetical protein